MDSNRKSGFYGKHPRFFMAMFGAFFKMLSLIKFRKIFDNKLLSKTSNDDKIPTNHQFDADVEKLAFYMEHIWPLIGKIIREKLIYFFRYKFKKTIFKFFIFCVIICAVFFGYKAYKTYVKKPKVILIEQQKEIVDGMIINTDTIFIPAERSMLTKDNLDYFASEMDIQYWYYVRNQIIQETSFTSTSLTEGHNLFGMKFPGQRETTAIDTLYGHAKFKHWTYSLYDYKLWQDLMMELNPIQKGESYPQWLKRIGYAESETYSEALQKINWYRYNFKEF